MLVLCTGKSAMLHVVVAVRFLLQTSPLRNAPAHENDFLSVQTPTVLLCTCKQLAYF